MEVGQVWIHPDLTKKVNNYFQFEHFLRWEERGNEACQEIAHQPEFETELVHLHCASILIPNSTVVRVEYFKRPTFCGKVP